MVARIFQILMVGSLAICLASLAGCESATAGRSNLVIKIGDREVKASIDGPGFISQMGNSGAAVITFAAGKLVIEKAVVRLDGEELAKLPEETRKVEVEYTAGKLTVMADGENIVSKELQK